MRFLGRSLTGLFMVALTAGLMALAAGILRGALVERAEGGDAPREARERTFTVEAVTVTPRTVAPILTTYGEVIGRVTLEVRAAMPGAVLELGPGVEEGGVVEAGQLLFRIDPVAAETALAIARTDLQDAQAEGRDAARSVALARDDLASVRAQSELQSRALARQRDLAQRGVGTSAAVEAAELTVAAADQSVLSRRQALAQAEARADQAATLVSRSEIAVAEAERKLADTEVRAAVSGVLLDVVVGRGGLVSANERLATLVDPDALEIAFRVSTGQYSRLLRDGRLAPAELTVSLDTGGLALTATGRIDRESGSVGEGQTGRLLYARLDDAAGFRPGDFATVAIEEPSLDDVAVLPASAVGAGGNVLAIAPQDDGPDRLELARVEVLRRQGDDVIVRPGDLAGRDVVADRAPQLGPGIGVTVRRRDGGDGADGAEAADAAPEMMDLTEEHRARLVAFVEASDRMPADARERMLAQLRAPQVPAATVARIEGRMGG